jgi:pseudouridine-5'-phosphate glycosidase
LNLRGGIVIANPVPELHALNSVDIEEIISRVNQEVLDLDISGKDITPFMLQRIEELTGGNSLHTNIQLVINNSILGAQIAVDFSRLTRGL